MLVRTWNLFHGNTVPPGRTVHVEEMVRLAVADGPGVVCLQEVPLWALDRLGDWSGMAAFGEPAERASIGPLPSTPALGRALTSLHPGVLRSAFNGQANAILVRPELRPTAADSIVLNPPRFRRAQARWLRLPPVTRLAWAGERRVCQAVRLTLPDGRPALVANLHATAFRPDARLADAELLRAAVFADSVAGPDDVVVLAGDFNARKSSSWTLRDLAGPEWGFTGGGQAIDHVLVRGATVKRHRRWAEARRRRGEALLSDHAPVDAVIE